MLSSFQTNSYTAKKVHLHGYNLSAPNSVARVLMIHYGGYLVA